MQFSWATTIVHPRTGVDVLNRVVEACEDIGNVESRPNMEGKRMFMIIGPKAGVAQRKKQSAKQNKKPADKKKSAKEAKPKEPVAETKEASETAATTVEAKATSTESAAAPAASES